MGMRKRRAVYVACVEKPRNAYEDLARNPEGKR
jgi:hypothetical protein